MLNSAAFRGVNIKKLSGGADTLELSAPREGFVRASPLFNVFLKAIICWRQNETCSPVLGGMLLISQ